MSSLAVQVQRVCLEAAVPGLINGIVENAAHGEDSFLQDPDIMVVYLEQLVGSRHQLPCTETTRAAAVGGPPTQQAETALQLLSPCRMLSRHAWGV